MGRGQEDDGQRVVVCCLIPPALAPKLHDVLRRHFADAEGVEVVVERRRGERRSPIDRRITTTELCGAERRRIRSLTGRRIAELRAALVPTAALELPRRARAHSGELEFVERLESTKQALEDIESARLVMGIQAGNSDAFADLYMRYFDRIYQYLVVVLASSQEAEEATQQVFVKALGALADYEYRGSPVRAWLFAIAHNQARDELRRLHRVAPADPWELERHREQLAPEEAEPDALDWISDRELMLFVRRLPLAQREVLLLRYAADLSDVQIGLTLGRTPTDVRMLQSRALRFLRERLTAVGRGPAAPRGKIRMRRWPREAPVLRARRWSLIR